MSTYPSRILKTQRLFAAGRPCLLLLWLLLVGVAPGYGDLEDGLIVHFRLNGGPGDTSAFDRGTLTFADLVNDPTWTSTGLRFNGSNQYVKSKNHVGNLNGGNRLSIAAWIKPERANTWEGILTKGIEKSPYTFGMHVGGKLIFGCNVFSPPGGNGWQTAETSGTVPLNAWSHVAVTYDGATLRFYINGALDSEHERAIVFGTIDEALTLGGDLPGGDEHYQGELRDVRVYNRALTASDLAELSPANLGTAFTGLWVGQATMNEVKEVQSDAWGAAPAFSKQVLLHVDTDGNARLLREAIVMKTRVIPPHEPDPVIVTSLEEVPNYDGIVKRGNHWVGQRFSSASLPLPKAQVSLATSGDWLAATSTLSANHPLNPFRHKYHPDLGTAWEITRTLRLDIDESDGPDDHRITGTLWDSVDGLHQDTLECRGAIAFTRVTTSGELK